MGFVLPLCACPDGGPFLDTGGFSDGAGDEETTDTEGEEVCVYPRFADSTEWEFIGYRDKEFAMRVNETPPTSAPPGTDPSSPAGHRLLAINAQTGEVYRSTQPAPPLHRRFPSGTSSRGDTPRTIIGAGDDRKWVDGALAFPFSAMAALLPQTGEEAQTKNPIFAEDNHRCSGAFVGPRHILTAAHCISVWSTPPDELETENNVYPHAIARARNGPTGQAIGEAAPHGVAEPRWYFIPEGWEGDGPVDRYDYALIVVDCADESPVWLGMAVRTEVDINSEPRTLTGYPRAEFVCEDTPFSDAECESKSFSGDPWPASCCGSFMYTETCGVTTGPNLISHTCDTQAGQSGAPHYGTWDGNVQVVGNHINPGLLQNASRRMREPSFNALCDAIGKTPSSELEHDCF